MTDERMALLELVEKSADADLVCEMLAFAAERIMDAEAELLTGASKGARTALRETHRNGYRDRDWDTRAGRIELAIPKLSGISKSTVSKLCKDIDERVREFLDRPIAGDWPYLWLDATYLKVRQGGRIVSVAAIIALAVDTDGRREIIGLCVGPSEAETFWTEFLRSLKSRGPRRREAGDLQRAHRPQGRHRAGLRGDLATMPRSLDQERARPWPAPWSAP